MIASTTYDEMWLDLRTRGKNKVAETENVEKVAETEINYQNGDLVLVRKTELSSQWWQAKIDKSKSKKDTEGNEIDGYDIMFRTENGWQKKSYWVRSSDVKKMT
jgi:hypothetical protein